MLSRGRVTAAVTVTVAISLAFAIVITARCLVRDPLPCGANPALSPEEQTVIILINGHRDGLQAVAPNIDLSRAAQWKADDMARNKYIAHDDPELRSWDQRVRDCGYPGGSIGETLAYGQQSAQEVVQAWIDSPEHNAILLGTGYRDVGVGVADADDGTRYWAADFGGP